MQPARKKPRLVQPLLAFSPIRTPPITDSNGSIEKVTENELPPVLVSSERFVGEHVEALWDKDDDDQGQLRFNIIIIYHSYICELQFIITYTQFTYICIIINLS
jgi:hypothetical protein